MKSKTIFVTVFHSFISKNFLNTKAFDILRNIPNIKYILLVPIAKVDYFREYFHEKNIDIVGVDNVSLSKNPIITFYSRLSHLLIHSHYLWYKKVERRDMGRNMFRYLKYYGEILFTSVFGGKKVFRNIFRYFFIKKVIVNEVSKIFDKYKPDMIFSSDVFDDNDTAFSAEARRHGIKIVGMVRSWDNCYSKGVLKIIPDILIVNNQTLLEEAVIIHDVSKKSIRISGLPQYDEFVNGTRSPREEFFKTIGADMNKRLILYAPAGSILSDTDIDICHILKNAITDKFIKYPVQILVRNHPHHPAFLEEFAHDKDLIVENPGKRFSGNLKEVELTKQDAVHLGDSLYYSDIVIWTATTLGIDSLIFDKPQIAIDFDGFQNKRYTRSVRRYHHEDHMKKMIAYGGIWIVENTDELIEAINAYLDNPKIHAKERELMFRQQIMFKDGKSGERVAGFLKESIDNL